MATSSLSGFGDADDEFPPDMGDLDAVLPMTPAAAQIPAVEQEKEPEFDPSDLTMEVEELPKELLDVRGFFVASGAGIYDGATRDNEEPRDSFYVDVQDYETGAIKRVWGVVLGEVMSQATAQYELQPGSRVHLLQQGKREVFTDSVVNGEMKVRRTYANAWVCMPDRGPLPSQLAHLMSGINVDQTLERIALRHDMGLDDPRMPGWKAEQKRILRAFGDDPQTIKGWLGRQLVLSAEEERKLVTAAVELRGYTEADPERRQHEIESRLAAIREMEADARYDFLMEGAKPHLIEANRSKEEGLRADVVQAIEQVAVMATATDHPDSPRRKAMRSSIVQSLEGLSLTQQMDYIAQRREKVLQGLSAALDQVDDAPAPRVRKDQVINAQGLSSEEYQLLLEERIKLGDNKEEQQAILASEIEARKAESHASGEEFAAIDYMYQRFSRERDPDALAFIVGETLQALGRFACKEVMPRIATTFESLGGLGAWRKRGCVAGLDDLQGALAKAKQSPVYQAFENDPAVVAACAGTPPGEVLAKHPDLARSEVVMGHLDAQGSASAPSSATAKSGLQKTGLWSGVSASMTELSDRVSRMSPENLLKGGKLDTEWMQTMQKGLQDFGKDLKETLMPEQLRAQLEVMIAAVISMIRAMADLAKQLVAGKAPKAPAAAAAATATAAGMEP